jgi:hypothetical protein
MKGYFYTIVLALIIYVIMDRFTDPCGDVITYDPITDDPIADDHITDDHCDQSMTMEIVSTDTGDVTETYTICLDSISKKNYMRT